MKYFYNTDLGLTCVWRDLCLQIISECQYPIINSLWTAIESQDVTARDIGQAEPYFIGRNQHYIYNSTISFLDWKTVE